MSRLGQWLQKLTGIQARKRGRYRAYQSEVLRVRLEQVQQTQKNPGKGKR